MLQRAREAVAAVPASAEAHYRLAHLLQAANDPAGSLKIFTAAAALRKPSAEDLRTVGLDYVMLNDTADAQKWLRASIALNAGNAEAWYDLGRNEMTIGDYGQAEKAMRKALALQPDLAKAENNLGLALEALNQPEDAEAAYRRAVQLQAAQPHRSEQPLLNLGLFLIGRGSSMAALPLLEQAVNLAPADPRCQAALSRARADTGHVAEAVAPLEKAVSLDEANPRLHFQLGRLYRRVGNQQAAAAELKRSKELYGNKSSEPVPGK